MSRSSKHPAGRLSGLLACLGALGGLACGGPITNSDSTAGTISPRARPELVEMLREDVAAPRHPSDGGGSARIDLGASTPGPHVVGSSARFEIVYEAGPLGVDEGGSVFLQASSFWGWSPAQSFDPTLPGYTTASTEAEGLILEPETYGGGLVGLKISGRRLESGEALRIVYGAGEPGARVDRYAESGSRIWIAVDGDGDGIRKLLPDPPEVDIVAAAPQQMIATLPSVARPGEPIRLTLAVVDALGNAGHPISTRVELVSSPAGLQLPQSLEMTPTDEGALSLEVWTTDSGIFHVAARTDSGLVAQSNPVFVTTKLPRILWADLHGHSKLSDGTQTPEGYYRYARDVAGLDAAALTDHDHWGMQPLALNPEIWRWIRQATASFHEPGRFVTVLGYEWTNWMQGHRHVLYFSDEGEVLSSLDERYERPEQLWEALEGKPALTFAHHSAGEPVPTNWDVPPHPTLEPVTEIVSVHGSSEAMDSPGLLRGPLPGNTVRDALDLGYRLGFIGSGDSHDGHPGLAGLASPSSGLAALITEDHTRQGVREALANRRTYATNGARILLHATLDGLTMGSGVTPGAPSAVHQLTAMVLGTRPVARIELIRSGAIVEAIDFVEPRALQRIERSLPAMTEGEYLYLRIFQDDGGMAWSSPFFAISPNG